MDEHMFARRPDDWRSQGATIGCYRPGLRAAIV